MLDNIYNATVFNINMNVKSNLVGVSTIHVYQN